MVGDYPRNRNDPMNNACVCISRDAGIFFSRQIRGVAGRWKGSGLYRTHFFQECFARLVKFIVTRGTDSGRVYYTCAVICSVVSLKRFLMRVNYFLPHRVAKHFSRTEVSLIVHAKLGECTLGGSKMQAPKIFLQSIRPYCSPLPRVKEGPRVDTRD